MVALAAPAPTVQCYFAWPWKNDQIASVALHPEPGALPRRLTDSPPGHAWPLSPTRTTSTSPARGAVVTPAFGGLLPDRIEVGSAAIGGSPEVALRQGGLDWLSIPCTGEAAAGRATRRGHGGVKPAVDHQGRHCIGWHSFVAEHGRGHRCDGGNSVGEFDPEAVGHHAAVRHASGVDASGIHWVVCR